MENIRGAMFMIAAMAGFAVEDMFLKAATQHIPVGEALILFGGLGALIFAGLALQRGDRVIHPLALSRPMLWRHASEVFGRIGFTLAIALTPLSTTSAILQATPLVVAAGAVVFFGETVGWRRWSAIFVGFIGVLMVIRPGVAGFDPLSILAVIGMLGFAGRDLATRAAPKGLSTAQLGVYGFLMLVVAGICVQAFSGPMRVPAPTQMAQIAAATLFGVMAYSALTRAMRTGELSAVTPFRYSRLIFALIFGAVVFGERPDALTYAGSALIVASGIYIMLRGRRA
ncbi:MAG: DMT family transporter [Pseudomonadota bacterium]|nr:DMT family transporter [Pseudomonadota bacterium]